MWRAGPLRTQVSGSIVWMSMPLRAHMSLSQHPIVMSETSSMFVHTLHNPGGPDTSSAPALVFSFPYALLKRSIECSFW